MLYLIKIQIKIYETSKHIWIVYKMLVNEDWKVVNKFKWQQWTVYPEIQQISSMIIRIKFERKTQCRLQNRCMPKNCWRNFPHWRNATLIAQFFNHIEDFSSLKTNPNSLSCHLTNTLKRRGKIAVFSIFHIYSRSKQKLWRFSLIFIIIADCRWYGRVTVCGGLIIALCLEVTS